MIDCTDCPNAFELHATAACSLTLHETILDCGEKIHCVTPIDALTSYPDKCHRSDLRLSVSSRQLCIRFDGL
jgi:hypothetical protein